MAHIRGNEPIQTPTAQTADQSQIIKAGAIFLGGRFRWVHLSNQIVEALISLKTKKIPILRAAPFAKRAAFRLTPSCAECPILPHGVSPYRESKSCQQV